MRLILKEEAKEFIAKYLGDLSKAIFTVGLASYFFKDLPLFFKMGIVLLGLAFLIGAVIIIEKKGE